MALRGVDRLSRSFPRRVNGVWGDLQTRAIARVLDVGPGQALVLVPLFASRGSPRKARGWSAERRFIFESPPCGGRVPCDRHARHPALHLRRFVSLDPNFRFGSDRTFWVQSSIREAFAFLHPNAVQPLKAAPRSRSGRAPRASRKRGANPPAGAARPEVSLRLRAVLLRGESPPRRPGCSTFRIASRSAPREQAGGI